MRRLSAVRGIGLLFFFCFCSHVFAAGTDASAGGRTVTTKVGEVFVIALDANRTTGYQWVLARPLNEKKAEFICSKYKKLSDGRAGEAGEDLLLFKALSPGKIKIYLKYVRLWEKDKKPARKAVYTVIIRPLPAA
ncbi:hypothetical protein BU251_00730 [Candidatus Velamenicoccus archaeovorus]|uniref:Proteinase inhibitor I42 chagasin domain-containing protein n=1 Tax=Velamenicoccus archaeovorus TaxID=1930593 RepID=A0A410P2P5_VELA1|nr:protease inhibitor I42 family protein [Candidatus Velamenicoccus archaeovorus]QAT16362.1 hypothetical protein BU251_00730 [Candidatus Velamenicoccus archaeovorus]